MGKIAIFIDGAYLSKVLKESFASPQIDFSKLSSHLANGDPLLRTYYYNCMPYKSATPTSGENNRYNNMQRFINSLERLDRYEVKLGKLEYRGRKVDGSPIFQQKRVDILLGCDLVLLSAKQRIEKAILITGDSDFIPAIQVAKNEGVEIELIYDTSHMPHSSLTQIADIRKALSQADIDAIKK
ncbi:NYN domain-containing protein [uncultured Oscillibacter sp.]|uniref:NYN domain-containing protein n=1 Tax=uncultured Oscillibacter sp. TaxID=876091 RepID=UPI002621B6F8|nr:NYN domain-containing protein [uncultured Oscillibacter sp.]